MCQSCFRSATIPNTAFRCFRSLETNPFPLATVPLFFRGVRSRRDFMLGYLAVPRKTTFLRRISGQMSVYKGAVKESQSACESQPGSVNRHNFVNVSQQQMCLQGSFAEHLNRFQTYI